MAIEIVTKYLDRRGWPQMIEGNFAWTELDTPDLRGVAGLLHIHKVKTPLSVTDSGRAMTIADSGYDWLAVAPEGEHWWLTAMYTPQGEPVQFYFDITRNNFIRGGGSCFEDLMLDVVLLSDDTCSLMDMDELDAALRAGNITPAEHRTACKAAQELLDRLPERAGELRRFCGRLREKLRRLPKGAIQCGQREVNITAEKD